MENSTENSQGFMIKRIKTDGVESTIDETLEITETSIFEELKNWVANPSCDLEIIATCKLPNNLEGCCIGEIMPELPMVISERNGNSITDTFYGENNTKNHHPNPIFVINSFDMQSIYSLSTDDGTYCFLKALNGYQIDWRSLSRFSILLYFPWFDLLKTEKARNAFTRKMCRITKRLFQILIDSVEMTNFLVNFPEPKKYRTRNLNLYNTYFKDQCVLFEEIPEVTKRLEEWAKKRNKDRGVRVTRITQCSDELYSSLKNTGIRIQNFCFNIFKGRGTIKYDKLVEQCNYVREPLIIYIDILKSVRSCDVDHPFKDAINSICRILLKYNLAEIDNCWFFLRYPNMVCENDRIEETAHTRTASVTERFYKFLDKACKTWHKDNLHVKPKEASLIDDCFTVNGEEEWTTTDVYHFARIISSYSCTKSVCNPPVMQVMRVYTKGIFHKMITTNRSMWSSEGVEITRIKFSKFSKEPYKVERFTAISTDDRKEFGKGIFVIEIIGHSLYNQDSKQIAEKIVDFLEKNPKTNFNYFMSGCCIVLCIDRKCVKTGTGIKQMDKTIAEIVREMYRLIAPKWELGQKKYFDQMIRFAALRKQNGGITKFSLKDALGMTKPIDK